ncbi:MAG: hypothetical protein MZV70_07935 [Desulfobacterales bacterium]|nr:hypothetical protein [Desulfobacterales bacterium]
MLPTLLAAAGDTTVKEDLLKGRDGRRARPTRSTSTATTCCPALKGEAAWPRKEFIYWTDDGSVAALRYDNWKITFLEQEAEGLRRLAGAVRRAARADAHQPAHGSVRARRARERHGLPALVHGAHVRDRARRRLRRPVAAELQGVPAAPEARQLQPRPRDGSGHEQRRQAVARDASEPRARGRSRRCPALRPDRDPAGYRSRHETRPSRIVATGVSGSLHRARCCAAARAGAGRRPAAVAGTTAPRARRIVAFVDDGDASRAARTSCRPPSASPSSTTTARCGPSSRCTSSSPSRSTA